MIWLRLEGLFVLAISTLAYWQSGGSWIWSAALFLVPDLSLLGYLMGPRAGAVSYNLAHSYVGPICALVGIWLSGQTALLPFALIWFAHIGFDRALGYGLKYMTGFRHTHLGEIGREHARQP